MGEVVSLTGMGVYVLSSNIFTSCGNDSRVLQ